MAYWPDSWPADREISPEARELIDDMTLLQALEEVLAAAEMWDNEMSEYIIPAVDVGDPDDEETLEGYVENGMVREKAMDIVADHLKRLREEEAE